MTHSTSRTAEEWRPVAGYEGRYEVSNLGRVRSLRRPGVRDRILRGHILYGYRYVELWRDGEKCAARVNRLVATAFLRPPSDDEVCRHLNGDKTDNRAANLQWGTQAENIRDTIRLGRHRQLNKTHCPSGHPYDEANTSVYVDSKGRRSRRCRACIRTGAVRRYQARRQADVA